MNEAAKTILQQRIFIWGLVAVIIVLLVVIAVLVHDLKEIDMDSRIARGRKKQERMEQHPKRTKYPLCDALVGATDCIEKLNAAFSGRDKNGGPE